VWLRVPVPEFDLPQVNLRQPVHVVLRGNGDNGAAGATAWDRRFQATPLALIPQVDTVKHTADLLYEVSPYSVEALRNAAARMAAALAAPLGPLAVQPPLRMPFAKDQMVTVFIPLGQKRTETVVPYSAVVFDSSGGSWIYLDRSGVKEKDRKFERRRVELGPTVSGG